MQKKDSLDIVKFSTDCNLNVNVNKDDIVAIRVVQEEEYLNSQILAEENVISTLNQENSSLRSKMSKIVSDICEKHRANKKLNNAIKTLNELGFNAKLSVSNSVNEKDGNVEVRVRIGKGYDSQEVTHTHDLPKEWMNHSNQIKKNNDEITACQMRVIKHRKSLAEIPSLERKARASIAEMSLSQSSEGKEILKRMKGVRSFRELE